jgi:hypothetical protein
MLSRWRMRRIASPKSGATETTATFGENITGSSTILLRGVPEARR